MRLARRGLALAALASAAAADQADGVTVRSSPFASSITRLAWAGASGLTCDEKCKETCLSATAGGDAAVQRADACLAGCGCGGGADHVFAMTESGSSYVSLDAGDSWRDLHSEVPGFTQKKGAPYAIKQVHVSHADPRCVVLLTNTTTSWMSHDGGSSWTALRVSTHKEGNRIISGWRWHPTRKDWALAESLEATSVQEGRRPLFVFYTQDGGASWKLLASRVEQSHWAGRPGGDGRRVLLSRYLDEKPRRSFIATELVASEDFMATHKVLLGKEQEGDGTRAAVGVHLHYNFIFALVPLWAEDGSGPLQVQLHVYSEADQVPGKPARFRAVHWPSTIGHLRARRLQRIQVLYAAEHTALFYLPAEDRAMPWGHVFSCSFQSPEAELVLADVHRPDPLRGPVWQPVGGIDGVFIANRAVLDRGQDFDEAEGQFDAQAMAVDDFGSDGAGAPGDSDGSSFSSDVAAAARPRFAVRSYISVNMGLAWQTLRAPSVDLDGQPFPGCGSNCTSSRSPSLHLAKWSSAAAAPGIVVGVGNAGVRLSDDEDHYAVFVSRDAGLTWQMVLEDPHEVTILGHGDAFVAVPSSSPDNVLYSTDSGTTWKSVVVIATNVQGLSVAGLFAHPAHADWRVLAALGSDASAGLAVASLDLSGVLAASCQMPEKPGDPSSDFERWSPADALEDAHTSKRPVCLFGVRTQYVRRKAVRACKTGLLKLAPLDLRKDTPCQCRIADWACDVGYHRTSYTGDAKCVLIEGAHKPNVTKMCADTTASHVEVTRGYARMPGNRCEGGLDMAPTKELCELNVGISGAVRRARLALASSSWRLYGVVFSLVLVVAVVLHSRLRGDGGLDAGGGVAAQLMKLRGFGRSRGAGPEDEEEREFLIPGNSMKYAP